VDKGSAAVAVDDGRLVGVNMEANGASFSLVTATFAPPVLCAGVEAGIVIFSS
jgi:hypothetical protein